MPIILYNIMCVHSYSKSKRRDRCIVDVIRYPYKSCIYLNDISSCQSCPQPNSAKVGLQSQRYAYTEAQHIVAEEVDDGSQILLPNSAKYTTDCYLKAISGGLLESQIE